MDKYRKRQSGLIAFVILAIFAIAFFDNNTSNDQPTRLGTSDVVQQSPPPEYKDAELAVSVLNNLEIKGRAPKTGYSRAQFGSGWESTRGCDTRNIILNRDLSSVVAGEQCRVVSGVLNDPYSGKIIYFTRGSGSSADVQIDHVVALSDAWQKGAQGWQHEKRVRFSNDPLNLLAVSGPENQLKGDSDAASWLPPNKSFRCQYIARQITVKDSYDLWVTQAEFNAMKRVLASCPNQTIIAKN